MTISYSDELRKLASEILAGASCVYSQTQLAELPRILNTKAKYFWCTDLNLWDQLADVFTPEGFQAFWNGHAGAASPADQVASAQKSVGQGDMVPMHFGHNQIVQFLDDSHARLLTRMNDYHTYTDNGDIYAGYGMYVDDLTRCPDGVWRIAQLRLDYGVILGQLRSARK